MAKTNSTYLAIAALSLSTLCACGLAIDTSSSMRSQLHEALSEATLGLGEAVALAEEQVPGAAALEAELDFEVEEGGPVYEVELYLDGMEYEVEISAVDGSILEVESGPADDEDLAELEAAAALVAASPGWASLIEIAEGHVSGAAFEAEVDEQHFELELLSEQGIHEVVLDADGNVVSSEVEDDDAWEEEEQGENEEDEADEEDEEATGGEDDEDATGGEAPDGEDSEGDAPDEGDTDGSDADTDGTDGGETPDGGDTGGSDGGESGGSDGGDTGA